MKKRLLTVTGVVALIAIASLVAFNAGERSGAKPTLATSNVAGDIGGAPAVSEPVAQEISEPEVVDPVEAVQSEVAAVLETEPEPETPVEVAQPEVAAVLEAESEAGTPVEVVQSDGATEIETEAVGSNVDQPVSPPAGPQEGIKVRGHWTIDVLEPDGKLVSHNEFENALLASGGELLSAVLGHDLGVGFWTLQTTTSGVANKPCNTGAGFPSGCTIYEVAPNFPQPNQFTGLLVEAPTTGINSGNLVGSGSFTAINPADINLVKTSVRSCDANSTPASYTSCGSGFINFTSATLSPVVPVLAGQIVDVSVVISFS